MPIPFFGKQQQDGQQPGQEQQQQQQQQQQQPTETPTHHVPQVDRFETTLKDELKLQELQYPTADDVPGCMRLLYVNLLLSELYFLLTNETIRDEFLMCYGSSQPQAPLLISD